MSEVIPRSLIKINTLATTALAIKMLLTILVQGGKRFAAGSRPPEDAKLSLNKTLGKSAVQSYGTEPAIPKGKSAEDEEVQAKLKRAKITDLRWQRIVLNDLENIPLGLIVMWTSLAAPPLSTTAHAAFAITFAVSRIAHTYVYAKELQPHRAIVWFGGVASLVAMAVNASIGALVN